MNVIEYLLPIISGILLYRYADTVVDYVQYLPLFRSARDGTNAFSFKIIGILFILYGIGMLIYGLIPR